MMTERWLQGTLEEQEGHYREACRTHAGLLVEAYVSRLNRRKGGPSTTEVQSEQGSVYNVLPPKFEYGPTQK